MATPALPPIVPDPFHEERILITTTAPTIPTSETRQSVSTERLIIRPLFQSDIDAMHVLRTQPEVMIYTAVGKPDADMTVTQEKLDLFLPPNDTKTFNCAICWRETGEFIGMGGTHRQDGMGGWPELGYMFMKEHWGSGLGTEFVRGFLDLYSSLPRSRVEIKVGPWTLKGLTPSVGEDGKQVYEEQLVAMVEGSNVRSQRILEKLGFDCYIRWKETDLHDPTGQGEVVLNGLRYFPGRHGAPAPAAVPAAPAVETD